MKIKKQPKKKILLITLPIFVLIMTSIFILYVLNLTQYMQNNYDRPTKDFEVTIINKSGNPINATLFVNLTNGTNIYSSNISLDLTQSYTTQVITNIKGHYLIYLRLDDNTFKEQDVMNSYGTTQPYVYIYNDHIEIIQGRHIIP